LSVVPKVLCAKGRPKLLSLRASLCSCAAASPYHTHTMSSSSSTPASHPPLTAACAASRRAVLSAVAATAAPASAPGSDVPLLVIGGVDSAVHPLHEAILKYLALGAPDVHEPTLQPQHAALDDTVAVLTRRRAAILNTLVDGSPAQAQGALHGLARLRGAQVRRVSQRERDGDGEVAELFKLLAFVDLAVCEAASAPRMPPPANPSRPPAPLFAVPLSSSAAAAATTAGGGSGGSSGLPVELWPLVQGYALQDVGPGGFFTMGNGVADVGQQLTLALGHVDAHALKRLLGSGSGMLARQWRAFENTVGQIRNFGRRAGVLRCESVAEPLVSFHEFAAMQGGGSGGVLQSASSSSVGSGSPFLSRGAGVRVGRFTDLVGEGGAAWGTTTARGAEADALPLAQCGPSANVLPVHAIAEADDPSTGLRLCRTVVLTAARPAAAADGKEGEEGPSTAFRAAALPVVLALYAAAAAALRDGVAAGAAAVLASSGESAAAAALEASVRSAVTAAVASAAASLPTLAGHGPVVVGVDAIDAGGRSINTMPASAPFALRRLYYVKVAVSGIRVTVEGEGAPSSVLVGSVAAGETVVVLPSSRRLPPSPFAAVSADGSAEVRPALLVAAGAQLGAGAAGRSHRPPLPLPIVRFLTAQVPLSHVFCVGGAEGRAAHALTEAVTSSSSATAAAAAGAVAPKFDAFAVANYGGGVGRGGRAAVQAAAVRSEAELEAEAAAAAAAASSALQQSRSSGSGAAPIPDTPETVVGSLGKLAPAGVFHGVTLLTGGALVGAVSGTLRVYERGFVLLTPSLGPIVVSAAHHIASVKGSDGGGGDDDASSRTSTGVSLILGADVVTTQLRVPARTAEAVKTAQGAWIDSAPDAVLERARSLVESTGLAVTSATASTSTAPAPPSAAGARTSAPGLLSSSSVSGVSTSAAEAALVAAPDVVLLRTRPSASLPSPALAFAGTPSTSPAISCGGWMGLVLPHDGEMRACVMEALDGWREAASDAAASGGTDAAAEVAAAAGGLPAALVPGYARQCPFAWAWTTAWEDAYMLECALQADADAVATALLGGPGGGGAAPSPPSSDATTSARTPVFIVSGVAGSGSQAFAKGWYETLAAARPGSVALADATAASGDAPGGAGVGGSLPPPSLAALLAAGAKAAPGSPILLVAPYHSDPVDLASSLPSCGPYSVAACVTVVNGKQVHADSRRTALLPRLAESVSAGFCQALVVVGGEPVSGAVVSQDDAQALVDAAKSGNPGLQLLRLGGGGTSSLLAPGRPVPVPLPTAQALLRDLPAAYAHPRAVAIRHVTVPGWREGGDAAAAAAMGSSPHGILHVYAPEGAGGAGGATLSDVEALAESLRRVLAFLPVPTASTATFRVPAALDESAVHTLLRRLVALGVDRPAAVCVAGAEAEAGASADAAAAAPFALPGLRMSVPTSAGGEAGDAFVTAWHASGLLRLTEGAAGAGAAPARVLAVDATPHAIRMVPVDGSMKLPPTGDSFVLQVTGLGMGVAAVAQGLRRAVEACRPSLPLPHAARSSSALSPADLLSIVRLHSTELLPADVTYDGAGSYFDMTGNQLPGHPAAAVFSARHVAVHNAAASVWNRLVAACAAAAGAEGSAQDPEAACRVMWPGEKDAADVQEVAGVAAEAAAVAAAAAAAAVAVAVVAPAEEDEEDEEEGEGGERKAGDGARRAALPPPTAGAGADAGPAQKPAAAAPLALPPTTSEPWWVQVARAKAWLRAIPLNVCTLRLA
jgi:hypothetical protein